MIRTTNTMSWWFQNPFRGFIWHFELNQKYRKLLPLKYNVENEHVYLEPYIHATGIIKVHMSSSLLECESLFGATCHMWRVPRASWIKLWGKMWVSCILINVMIHSFTFQLLTIILFIGHHDSSKSPMQWCCYLRLQQIM